MTERLYFSDSYCATFEARVVQHLTLNDAPAVVLDRTAFYPTSGGQPHDTGTLNGVPVVDVVEREEDQAVVHVLSPTEPEYDLRPGDQVQGKVDWTRRFDHMQQHTGQHVLSQAFVQIVEADTVGFHLSDDYSTIDLNTNALSEETIAQAEATANQIIFDDRPVLARFLEPDAVAGLPLRKRPPAKETIRIVQVESFDWSACGGTHVARTGEIGLIKVVRSERRGQDTRITFLCGHRALNHYRTVNTLTHDLALYLTVGVEELSEAVDRLQNEARTLRKEKDRLRELLLDYEAAALTVSAQLIGPVSLVRKIFEMREMEEVRRLATRIANHPGHVALLSVKGEKAQFIFARSTDLRYDMRPLLQEACSLVGGSGGGGPELAQGGGPDAKRIDEALHHATELLRSQIKLAGGA
jgi:alanyl-tRNA synthetase